MENLEDDDSLQIFSSMSFQNFSDSIDHEILAPMDVTPNFPDISRQNSIAQRRKSDSRDLIPTVKRQKSEDIDTTNEFYDAEIIEDLGDSYKIKVISEGKSRFGIIFKDTGNLNFYY
jgi:hypothetical protein